MLATSLYIVAEGEVETLTFLASNEEETKEEATDNDEQATESNKGASVLASKSEGDTKSGTSDETNLAAQGDDKEGGQAKKNEKITI